MAPNETTTTDDAAEKYRAKAERLSDLASQANSADSIAEDAPVLSELFHTVRTSSRRAREGRYVALFDLTDDGVECRSVAHLESGTHYRDTGADLTLSMNPRPFLTVDEFSEQIAASIRRSAREARQRAVEIESQRRLAENPEQTGGW